MISFTKIVILNWEKYNPRSDVKRPSWFRMDNTIATGEKFFAFDSEEKWIWVFIMSMASQKNDGEFRLNYEYIHMHTKIPVEKIKGAVEKLESEGCIKLVSIDASQIDTGEIRASHARDIESNLGGDEQDLPATDITDITNKTGQSYMGDASASPSRKAKKISKVESKKLDPLRSAIYEVYPRRGAGQNMNKGVGMKRLAKIHSKEKLEKIKVASENYAKAQKENGNDGTKYTMQFSTFVNGRWEEWLETETTTKRKRKPRFGGEKCTQREESIL